MTSHQDIPSLIPAPKRIRKLRGQASADAPLTIDRNFTGRTTEGYKLTLHPDRVLIEAGTDAGVFYARQTLRQLREGTGSQVLPAMVIEDWPDYPVRGFYHDVTRGRVPKLSTLLELAEKCALYKINQLQLYIEHTFAFRRHREVWHDADPLTAEEIRALDQRCAELHIDLVPSFSTFGHLHMWIWRKFPELNELERDVSRDPFTWYDRQAHYTLDCKNPRSIELVRELINEVRPLFRSRFFNICADETFDLGKGRNRLEAERVGAARLYVDFLRQIMEIVREADATPMFWADVIGHHPHLVGELPGEAIALDWDYGPQCLSSLSETLGKSDRKYYVCSGIWAWSGWIASYDQAHENITRLAGLGLKRKASGFLNTDWGDYGHTTPFACAMPGMVLGASVGWNCAAPVNQPDVFDEAFSKIELGEDAAQVAALMRRAAREVKASWPGLALSVTPRPYEIPARLYDRASGFADAVFMHPAAVHIRARRNLQNFAIELERILGDISLRDPLAAAELRLSLQAVIAMEGAVLCLQRKAGRHVPSSAPSGIDVKNELQALERELARIWKRRHKASELHRIRKVLRDLGRTGQA